MEETEMRLNLRMSQLEEMAKNDNRRATAYADKYYRNNYRTISYKSE